MHETVNPRSKEQLPASVVQDVSDHVHSALDLKPLRRKIDKRLVCWYAFVFLFMKTNISNISNAAIMNLEAGNGIKKDLGDLQSSEWAWALSMFYYPYMVFEPLATLALKRFNPNVWMSRIMITWGAISMCQAATHNYAGILACRFFLGAAEAGFFPGVLFHLSFWYPVDRLPLRIAFFYACGMFSGTISGLLAFAISYMNGLAGLSGWRWVSLFSQASSYRVLTRTSFLYLKGSPLFFVLYIHGFICRTTRRPQTSSVVRNVQHLLQISRSRHRNRMQRRSTTTKC
jgi:hypothetical protein